MANPEYTKQIMLNAAEVAKRKRIFKALNSAYDLVVACSERIGMDRDEFKKHFSGIADDYKMAKLRFEVVKDAGSAGYQHKVCPACNSDIGFNEKTFFIEEHNAELCSECGPDYEKSQAEDLTHF